MRLPGRATSTSLRSPCAAAQLGNAAACAMIVVLLFWPLPRGNLLVGEAAEILPPAPGH